MGRGRAGRTRHATPRIKRIVVNPPTDEAKRLWRRAAELAQEFGSDEQWTLVGGLMVQLHAYEHGDESRPTEDIDVLGDARQRPSMTERISQTLESLGGTLGLPSRVDETLGYQFQVGKEIVEVLGPDGLREDPATLGNYRTIGIGGGTQALRRTEKVPVLVEGSPPVQMRRPSLLGAILLKARVLAEQRDKSEGDREDLIRLLGFVGDPRRVAEVENLTNTERKWLRDVDELIDFEATALRELFPDQQISRAEQAFRLFVD